MALSSKIIGRITKTTASSTHTANAIRAHTNGGFSSRGFSANRSMVGTSGRTVAGYGHSIVGRNRNCRPKALTADELQRSREIRNNSDGRNMSYARAAEEARAGLNQGENTRTNRVSFRDRVATNESSLGTNRSAGGRFGQSTNTNSGSRPMLGGATNTTARPVPTPTFRRPM